MRLKTHLKVARTVYVTNIVSVPSLYEAEGGQMGKGRVGDRTGSLTIFTIVYRN